MRGATTMPEEAVLAGEAEDPGEGPSTPAEDKAPGPELQPCHWAADPLFQQAQEDDPLLLSFRDNTAVMDQQVGDPRRARWYPRIERQVGV